MKKIVPIIFQTLENRGVPMNPVLKYRGGKSREIPRFLQYIPDDFNHYIEPFLVVELFSFILNLIVRLSMTQIQS